MTRPEIIFLPGIMGSHLRDRRTDRRVWLEPGSALTDVAEALTLGPGGAPLDPDGLLWPYWRARDRWRCAGWTVRPLSFDWRRGIGYAVRRLRARLTGLLKRDPGRRFALVGHSMGGVVAVCYAGRYPDWADHVEQIIVAAAPLKGTLEPLAMALGVKPLALAFALFNLRDDVRELQRMAVTLPGAIDLLPDRQLGGPALDRVFEADRWPAGLAPAQRLLDQSRALKREICQSPGLARTTALAHLERGTPTGARLGADGRLERLIDDAPGDGVVAGRSMVLDGLAGAWELPGQWLLADTHSLLVRHPGFIRAVPAILSGRDPTLPPVRPDDPRLAR